jgi:hypothetical protein
MTMRYQAVVGALASLRGELPAIPPTQSAIRNARTFGETDDPNPSPSPSPEPEPEPEPAPHTCGNGVCEPGEERRRQPARRRRLLVELPPRAASE